MPSTPIGRHRSNSAADFHQYNNLQDNMKECSISVKRVEVEQLSDQENHPMNDENENETKIRMRKESFGSNESIDFYEKRQTRGSNRRTLYKSCNENEMVEDCERKARLRIRQEFIAGNTPTRHSRALRESTIKTRTSKLYNDDIIDKLWEDHDCQNMNLYTPQKNRKSTAKRQKSIERDDSDNENKIDGGSTPQKSRKIATSAKRSVKGKKILAEELHNVVNGRSSESPVSSTESLDIPDTKLEALCLNDEIPASLKTPSRRVTRFRKDPSEEKSENGIKVSPKRAVSCDNLKTPSKRFAALSLNDKTPKQLSKTPTRTKSTTRTPVKLFSARLTGNLTPSVQNRAANIVKPSTPLQLARARLHVSVLPKSLPCREKEFNDIFTFLRGKLEDRTGGCMYISGVPGTGKTATVNEVIRCLKKLVTEEEVADFEFVSINGMKLSEPRQAYTQIWKQLTGHNATTDEARQLLQNRFTSKAKTKTQRGIVVLLVDELDQLGTKRQDVVYNLLDWPTNINSQLVVITISNTMDLPERILMGKVTSRLGLTRLTFQPYNYLQLKEIVLYRMKGSEAFRGEAVELVARKVASVSGDARRALDICRRATEITEFNDEELVTMKHVNEALTEMIANPKIQAIKHCSEMEKIFLKAVCTEVIRTGVEEVLFKNVYKQLHALCTLDGHQLPNVTTTLGICSRLGAWRLIACEHSRADIYQKILLNVSTDDVTFALQKYPQY